jgi:hypothetical protein
VQNVRGDSLANIAGSRIIPSQNPEIFELRFVPLLTAVCCRLWHPKGKKRAISGTLPQTAIEYRRRQVIPTRDESLLPQYFGILHGREQ